MDFLLEALTNWLKEMLVGGIMSNLSGMFDSVNQQVADISVQVGQTPQGWNGSIFNMIENLPELKELVSLLRRSSNNLNQLTRKVHETGRIYDVDLEDISQRQEQLWDGVKEILTQLSKLS